MVGMKAGGGEEGWKASVGEEDEYVHHGKTFPLVTQSLKSLKNCSKFQSVCLRKQAGLFFPLPEGGKP